MSFRTRTYMNKIFPPQKKHIKNETAISRRPPFSVYVLHFTDYIVGGICYLRFGYKYNISSALIMISTNLAVLYHRRGSYNTVLVITITEKSFSIQDSFFCLNKKKRINNNTS